MPVFNKMQTGTHRHPFRSSSIAANSWFFIDIKRSRHGKNNPFVFNKIVSTFFHPCLFSITFRLRTSQKRSPFYFPLHADPFQLPADSDIRLDAYFCGLHKQPVRRRFGIEQGCAVALIRPGGAHSSAMTKSMSSCERPPFRSRFSRDQALPCAVRGPVDFLALRRLEASKSWGEGGRLAQGHGSTYI